MRWPRIKIVRGEPEQRSISIDDWFQMISWQGLQYGVQLNQGSLAQNTQEIGADFTGFVNGVYKANGIVFACIAARMALFSQIRFQFREIREGRTGDLFGTTALAPLENPGLNKTTADMLSEAELDVSLCGNWYGLRQRDTIRRLRPDWVTIVMGSPADKDVTGWDLNGELLGYIYQPGGPGSGRDPVALMQDEVAHYAPYRDPLAVYRGMSWLTPILQEVQADQAATTHKLKFFEQGATPNMIVSLEDDLTPEQFEKWIAVFEARYGKGSVDAYKTMYLAAGAKAQVVGANMQEIAFKETQGVGERRIAAAAGVPPPILGLAEDTAAPYSAYPFARRRMADVTLRHLWGNIAGSLQNIIALPPARNRGRVELWYDDSGIAFLKEDQKDAAQVQLLRSQTLKTLGEAGWEPDAAVEALTADDFGRLAGRHTGLQSVQLMPPGDPAPTNGSQKQLPPAGGTQQGRDMLARLIGGRTEDQ